MTCTLSITFIFVCLYAMANFEAAADTCKDIKKCIQPVIKFKSVTEGIPWASEEQGLCSHRDRVKTCLDGLKMTSCTQSVVRSTGHFVFILLHDFCDTGNQDVKMSNCANKDDKRAYFKDNVKNVCGMGLDTKINAITSGKFSDQEVCDASDDLQFCTYLEAEEICDSGMDYFLAGLWTGSSMAPNDCQSQWAYTYMLYKKLIAK